MEFKITNRLAECVGLWLAEGDRKTKSEITFTNNCIPLVELFGGTIQDTFKDYTINPRSYVYSANKEKIQIPLNCIVKYYTDTRANKPYIIYRISSVKILEEWKKIVTLVKNEEKFYKCILRGFFGGEGNIKSGSHGNRTIRISQGKRDDFIEQVLNYLDITYSYSSRERSYIITGKRNWEKFAKMKIHELHPEKRDKFNQVFNSYKEEHYPDNFIKNELEELLEKPYTTNEISNIFKRSPARIQDILIPLKEKGVVKNFRVKSKSYWINTDQNKIIISKIKEKYLNSLNKKGKTVSELSKEMNVCWKATYRRLLELQKLDLVVRDTKNIWTVLDYKKEVVVL
jgi:predicted transcriptional regulator